MLGADMVTDVVLGRRELLRGWLLAPAALVLGARVAAEAAADPACAGLTARTTEGPFYRAQPPLRTTLIEPGMTGTPLTLTGTVRTADCRPLARAVVDFWQADDRGEYDTRGFRLRGYQLTDADGRYELRTIVPGLYPGRTRHLHVKIRAPQRPPLTTQLYFPGEPDNARDGIYDPRLLVSWRAAAETSGRTASFDFVVDDTGVSRPDR
jgi:protocatechuate 3,4-dioxygenase beta subunit